MRGEREEMKRHAEAAPGRGSNQTRPDPNDPLQSIITYLSFKSPSVSVLKLMKMAYLVEVYFYDLHGCRLTDVAYKHHKFGAFSPDVYEALEALYARGVLKEQKVITNKGKVATIPKPAVRRTSVTLTPDVRQVIDSVVEEWGAKDTDELVRHTKESLPFVGTPFGELIQFTRTDPIRECAVQEGISPEQAATELVSSSPALMSMIEQSEDDVRHGRFVDSPASA